MRFTFKSINLVSITLLLSLNFSLSFFLTISIFLIADFDSYLLAQTLNYQKAQAERLIDEGTKQFENNQLEKALKSFQKALEIYRAIQDYAGEGTALANLGQVYYYQQNYAKAIDVLKDSLKITVLINDRKSEADILGIIGNTYYYLNDYPQAIAYLKKALIIAQENNYVESQWRSLRNLGSIYNKLGDYANAINYDLMMLKISEAIHSGEWTSLVNIAANYLYLGDAEKARFYCEKALDIVRTPDNNSYEEGGIFSQLGTIYAYLGDPQKAIDYLEKALKIMQNNNDIQNEIHILQNLSAAYGRQKNYPQAMEYIQKVLTKANKETDQRIIAGAFGNLGLIFAAQGDYQKAIDYYHKGLTIDRAIQSPQGEGQSLNNLGDAYYQSGDLIQAEKVLREGVKVWESQRAKLGNDDTNKISIFETQVSVYQILQEVLIAQNKIVQALEIAERGRSRAFVELLARRIFWDSTEQSKVLFPSLEQIQQVAKSHNSTLVQYSILQSKLYIWIVQPTGKVEFRQAEITKSINESLASLITRVRRNIGVRGRSPNIVAEIDDQKSPESLKQLHKLLIEPIADLLPTDPNAHVIFMPQGELFLVPFPALQDENGKYLIEKHTILTAPAIQVLDLTQQQRAKVQQANAKGLVIVGNPTMPTVIENIGNPPQQLPSLPAAETEAIAIATLLKTTALTGKDATKKTVLSELPQAKIIHLATHGLLDDFQGLEIPGAIALAPSGNDNGLLTASEILDLKLNAELVVLSACDTGRGRITGDGVIGLSRSLITAGVPSVIVSLWSVPDAPTAELMTEFYQNWQEKKLDKAQALRQAMLTTMKNHSNPKDWAAFTLIGEAN